MTDQVDWLTSYLARHANDHRRPTTDPYRPYQPSLYDVENDDDNQEQADV